MIILSENPYLIERSQKKALLSEELDALWNDYTIVQDTIAKAKIKTIFYKKQGELITLLKEEYNDRENIGEES